MIVRYEATDEEIQQLKVDSFLHDYTHYLRYDTPDYVYSIHEMINGNFIVKQDINEYVTACTFLLKAPKAYKFKEDLVKQYQQYFRCRKIGRLIEAF